MASIIRCLEHNAAMYLESTKVDPANHQVVDMFACGVPGCDIRYADKLGGYGMTGAHGVFVLLDRPEPTAT